MGVIMKKIGISIVLLLLIASFPYSQEQHQVTVTNIMVPVRVFDGDQFIEDLTLADFELLEDGQPQDIQALYLTHKADVSRMDTKRDYMPMLARKFYFIFQIHEYNPKITEAIEYFFNSIFHPEDSLEVHTPVKVYTLSKEAVQSQPKETLIKDMQYVIRKDAQIGAAEYNNMLNELKKIVRSISMQGGGQTSMMRDIDATGQTGLEGLQFLLPRYRETLSKMEELRMVDEKWFFHFAAQRRRLEQQKVVFFFYQREYRPEISAGVMNNLMSANQDDMNVMGQLQDMFQHYHREVNLNEDLLKQAFSDSGILFNFIFMDKSPTTTAGITMREQSEDVFKVFTEVAAATGGITDNSQNPAVAFRNASNITDRCYILYYSPPNYVKDKQFKTITVKVKGRDLKVIHRLGYFAE
jgi:hypothetical protein